MQTEKLTVMKDPSNNDFYIAAYSKDEPNEAHNLAYKGTLSDAIDSALSVWDLSEDESSIKLIQTFNQQDKPIAFVCHAPAALKNVKDSDGEFLVKNKKVRMDGRG